MRKCQLKNKDAETSSIKIGKYYTYEIITDKKNSQGNSVYLAFPYHIYDGDDLVDVLNKYGFLRDFIDITKQRKEKLEKIYESNL